MSIELVVIFCVQEPFGSQMPLTTTDGCSEYVFSTNVKEIGCSPYGILVTTALLISTSYRCFAITCRDIKGATSNIGSGKMKKEQKLRRAHLKFLLTRETTIRDNMCKNNTINTKKTMRANVSPSVSIPYPLTRLRVETLSIAKMISTVAEVTSPVRVSFSLAINSIKNGFCVVFYY
jgi:hypothetical protein